mmetsp:Transcript_140806/g.392476  ORF Transcript_140806/g.392476 Transcript_140806/m.392476 type:complete len:214 (-) Transcript_140806:92-733(-)
MTPILCVFPDAKASSRTAHCACMTSHDGLSRRRSMSTLWTPRAPRSSSIWPLARAAAAAGSGGSSLNLAILVVRKSVSRPREASTRATPSRSRPGWKSMCLTPSDTARLVAASVWSAVSPTVLSAIAGIVMPFASLKSGTLRSVTAAASPGDETKFEALAAMEAALNNDQRRLTGATTGCRRAAGCIQARLLQAKYLTESTSTSAVGKNTRRC